MWHDGLEWLPTKVVGSKHETRHVENTWIKEKEIKEYISSIFQYLPTSAS